LLNTIKYEQARIDLLNTIKYEQARI